SPLVELIARTLQAGVSAGCIRPGIDPVQLYISIAALGYFYFSNAPTLSAIFGRDMNGEKQVAERRRHVIEFVMAAIRPAGSAA
ncbi:MAG TPA: TetR/AcrR family transcriptional regulator, partial [Rhodopila sp.]